MWWHLSEMLVRLAFFTMVDGGLRTTTIFYIKRLTAAPCSGVGSSDMSDILIQLVRERSMIWFSSHNAGNHRPVWVHVCPAAAATAHYSDRRGRFSSTDDCRCSVPAIRLMVEVLDTARLSGFCQNPRLIMVNLNSSQC